MALWIIIPTRKKMRPKSMRKGKMIIDPMAKSHQFQRKEPLFGLSERGNKNPEGLEKGYCV
jgi:hypothetical protein